MVVMIMIPQYYVSCNLDHSPPGRAFPSTKRDDVWVLGKHILHVQYHPDGVLLVSMT